MSKKESNPKTAGATKPAPPSAPQKSEAPLDLPIKTLEPLFIQLPVEMMRKIEEAAEREFRTVELQVQFYLHRGMETAERAA